ncbi:5'-nucleotidase, lipoprotein e(P4) family [Vulcanibacillus modesticaldus]|uniref:5'-nucleotidase, lipoprotein e(P4) family n=1 Tax=Vulcanibacillus modesticaldus TaxID=337097 RepID=A0A1D2YRZ0_9BACI|nr:5'-nucleotidase, lipoprotein e(P4) family [Vulcanibacillus modesticaldus]OEF96387.1 5'-nucleotidase, lipoprotein e(P4) family [Vulcanibacillus modesticaldus]
MKKTISITLALLLVVSFVVTTQASAESGYIVKPGDTLGKIAKEYGLDWKKLAEINKLENPHLIFPGQKIVLSDYNTEDLNEQLVMATAWVQNSAEYRALAYQAFNVAKMILDKDLAENTSTEKRAIIVDVDETILDNSAYEAFLIGNDFGYSSKTWNPWMDAAEATAIPGAVEFLNYAAGKGVDIYYITNRKVVGKEGTLKNLKDLGFPQVDEEHLMLRTDTSSKTARRDAVDADHRIVLLMGDNLNDFSDVFKGKTIEERFAATDANKDLFGSKFIVLPNPQYGEWEGAIYNYNWGASAKEKNQMRKDSLKRWSFNQ